MAETSDLELLYLQKQAKVRYEIIVTKTEPTHTTNIFALTRKYGLGLANPDEGEAAAVGAPAAARFTKVQIRPGRVLEEDQKTAYYVRRLPHVEGKAAPFVPMPYVFRVGAPSTVKVHSMYGRCPPFHLLLDHTLAVVWLLFTDKQYDCPLGIAQLQWALAFLKTVHTRQGDHPKDVQTCIDVIEGILVELYAQMAPDMPDVTKIDETVQYVDGAVAPQSTVIKSIPFSLNYADMMNKSPALKGMERESLVSMTSEQAKEELNNLKKAAGVESIEALDTTSKHKAINVLKAWKSEQVEKIRGELKRLRSIENKMKDIDDNFEGYLEDDLEILYQK